jgi:hypothetical protein
MKNRNHYWPSQFLAVVVLLNLSALPAFAGTLSTVAIVDTPCFAQTDLGTSSASVPNFACTDAPPWVPDPPFANGFAAAHAAYGHLFANASVHSELDWGSAEATGSFTDTISIQLPGTGYLQVTFEVDAFEVEPCCATLRVGTTTIDLAEGTHTLVFTTPPSPLSALPLWAQLEAISNERIDQLGVFLDATLTGITVFDSNDNPLSGFTYTNTTNTNYLLAGGTLLVVPEPGTFLLIVPAALLMAVRRRRSPRIVPARS